MTAGATQSGAAQVDRGATVEEVVAEVTRAVLDLRASVAELRRIVEAALGAEVTPRRDLLAEVEPHVRQCLGDREGLFHGGGFVAAPGLLSDAAWWLEWFAWDSGRIQRLVAQTDPQGAHFFDYTLMPWYAVPEQGGGPTITGPYVDYLCTDDYTLTFTEEVRLPDGGFAGVVGADVRVLAVEEEFLGRLRRSPLLLALVNRLGRVVVSNSGQLLSGDLVGDVDVPALVEGGVSDRARLVRIADSELAVLALGPR